MKSKATRQQFVKYPVYNTLGRPTPSPSVCILLISERFNHFLPYS